MFRIVPALVGLLSILALALFADGIGRGGVIAAALLTAVSPAMAFYHGYYIHETLLAFSTLVPARLPRSNTMKLGVHNDTLASSLEDANLVCIYRPADVAAEFDDSLSPLGDRLHMHTDYDELVADLAAVAQSGDQVVFMSNGGFGSARQNLTTTLQKSHK